MKPHLFIAVLFSFTACATPYQQQSLLGGFSETQLSQNIFTVSFKGNGMTSEERAKDFTLLRSTEIALENGYRYFVIINSEASSNKNVVTTPKSSYTSGNISMYSGYNGYGSGSFNSSTTTYGGHSYVVSRPTTSNTILLLHDKPQDGSLFFDAEFLKKSLMEKYDLNQSKNDENIDSDYDEITQDQDGKTLHRSVRNNTITDNY